MADHVKSDDSTWPVKLEWLQETLNTSVGAEGVLLGAASKTISEDKGFASFVTNVGLQWDEKNSKGLDKLPKSVVIKNPTCSKIPQFGEDAVKFFSPDYLKLAHNREVFAYNFLNSNESPPFPMPRLYFAEEITDKSGGLLILEDLSENTGSAQFFDYFSLGKIEAIIDAITSIQAHGMKFPGWENKMDSTDKFYDELIRTFWTAVEFVRERFPGKFNVSDDQLRKLFEENKKTLKLLKDPEISNYAPVIAFGDLQPNNILWKLNSAGQPSDELAALLDFQFMHKSVSFEDLTYLLFLRLSPDDRRENEDRLIELYYKSLLEKVSPNKPPFTLSDSKSGYKLLFRFFAIMYVSMIQMFTDAFKLDNEGKEMMIRHLNAAMEDIVKSV